jgi:hypothetical protein
METTTDYGPALKIDYRSKGMSPIKARLKQHRLKRTKKDKRASKL